MSGNSDKERGSPLCPSLENSRQVRRPAPVQTQGLGAANIRRCPTALATFGKSLGKSIAFRLLSATWRGDIYLEYHDIYI